MGIAMRPTYYSKSRAEVVNFWLNEIAEAKKREKDFREDGKKILDVYDGTTETPFNILFSNTETLLPALYSAVPRPIVVRRFKDDDPLGKAAANAGQRALEFLVDTNEEGYETFDEGVRSATLDGLLPGRGFTRLVYDSDTPADAGEPQTGQDAPPPAPSMPYTSSERACLDSRPWNRVPIGYAQKWSKVPWVAYEEQIDKEEATRLFGAEIANQITYTQDAQDDENERDTSREERHQGEKKTALIYQIWDKDGGKKVRYISGSYAKGYLKEQDDPLQLTGFFNCPRPLQFIEKANDLKPTAMYTIYRNQAKELNRLTMRINRLVEAIKAKFIYDGSLGEDLNRIVNADDNTLVPADHSSSLAADKGLQNAIWPFPIEVMVNTLVQLYQAREQCKHVIYEITGISDIIRGSSVASETATAQNLKSQWGTLRLKRLQKEVQRYARDLLRMMLEIAATKFSEETWAKMTGLPFTPTAKAEQLQAIAQAAQQSGQPLDPQTQAQLQAPVWGQVLAMLKDDIQRAYRIDIETNSTIEPEAAEDQKNISEMMTAVGQFLSGVGPLVAKGVMPFQAAQSMLLAITRRFRFGNEIEDQIKAMQPPKPEDDGKAAQAQLEQQKLQLEAQKIQMEHTRLQTEEKRLQVTELAKHQRDTAAEATKRQTALDTLGSQQTTELTKIQAEKESKLAELSATRAMEEMKARIEQNTEMKKLEFEKWKVELEQATKITVAQIAAKAQLEQAEMAAEQAAAEEVSADLTDDGTKTKKRNAPIDKLADMHGQTMEMIGKLAKQMAAPKTVERDKNGRAVRVVTGE
jgi:hypothetical protein